MAKAAKPAATKAAPAKKAAKPKSKSKAKPKAKADGAQAWENNIAIPCAPNEE